MRIKLTESQLKSVLKVIKEDNLLKKFYGENSFENCLGIRLVLGPDVLGSSSGLTRKERRQLRKQTKKENKANYQNFLSSNSLTSNEIDMDYFLDLKEEKESVGGMFDSNPEIYDENGKPFTKNMTQSIVNTVEILFRDPMGSGKKILFWKNVFGNKKPEVIDFYNYFKQNGGEEGFDKLIESVYYSKNIYEILKKNVDEFNSKLRQQWPFVKPKGTTRFALIYYDKDNFGRSIQKVRYFNNYEEFAIATEVAKNVDKNQVKMGTTSPGGGSGEATIVNKPMGEKTQQLFK